MGLVENLEKHEGPAPLMSSPTRNPLDPRSVLGSWWAAAGVAILAVAIRLPWLGRVGLHGDEDISTLAARGVARVGWPQLPSGHGYWRAPLYHYLIAPVVATGVDWLPRLVSVAASVTTACLLVRLGRRWLGESAAVVGGILFAISLVEIQFARQIRMYALYQLVALLALVALFLFWKEGRAFWGYVSAGAVALSMMVHELGATLAVLFLLVTVRGKKPWIRLGALGGVVGFAVLSRLQFQWEGFAQLRLGGHRVVEPLPGTTAFASPSLEPAVFGSEPLGFGIGLLGPLAFWVVVSALIIIGGALALAGTRDLPAFTRALAAAGLAAALGAAGAHQTGMAVALLLLLLLQRAELFPGRQGGRVLVAAGLIVVGTGLAWGLAGIALGHSVKDVAFGLFGRHLGRFVEPLVAWPPVITLTAIAGAAAVLIRSWLGKAADGERFLLLAILGLTAGRSLLAGKWKLRYLSDVWLLWELMAAWAIVGAFVWLSTRRLSTSKRRVALSFGTILVVLAAASLPGTSPARTLSFLARQGDDPPPAGLSKAARFVPDLRGATDWLKVRLKAGERVVATDWLTTYCYLGQVDGWIRSQGYGKQSILVDGTARDVYLGAEVLPDVAATKAFASSGPLWIVVGGRELANPVKLDPTVREWLMSHKPSFIAADGQTRVLRIEPADSGNP